MKRSQLALLVMVGSVGMAMVATSGCSSDDSGMSAGGGAGAGHAAGGGAGHAAGSGAAGAATAGSGGSAEAGHAGLAEGGGKTTAGSGGLAGGAAGGADLGPGGGGSAGAAGEGGAAGSSGAAGNGQAGTGEGGSGGETASTPCGPSSLTKPTVPSDIEVAASAVLVAAYAAEGTQTYTCQATGTGSTATYAWSTASVPSATLYGATCAIAGTHYAGPHWKANDGSIILGAKVRSAPSSTAGSIAQLILSATVDAGTSGIFTPVTAVQRLNTVGGIAPGTGCDAAHVSETVAVPYTATYYFYSGSNIIP